ncbi:MAG TPA: hypothetical protein PKA06_02990 [Gemmatales bacterium]|nr:hypothetical protein [Gemmatales bacterium]HMP16090.1 hypothetical protein [Gemmatales bacterium]
MKSFSSLIMALSLLTLPGCKLLMDTSADKPVIQAPPLKVTQKTTPISPEEITTSNAKSKAQQLLEELENDE